MRRAVLAVAAVVAFATGCAEESRPTPIPTDSCIGSGCTLTYSPPTQQAVPTATEPTNVSIKLAVHSVSGDFGGYIVNLHDGTPAKQTTFHTNGKGEWSKTITVPNASMVKLDIARIGATCEITDAATGEVLVHDENSCIVGS